MDTKSKKFDRSLVTKTVAFVLAMLFAALGTVQVISFLDNHAAVLNNNAYAYFENMFIQGENFELETSEMFLRELRTFVNHSKEKAFVCGDGSKQAYEKYQKKLDNEINKEVSKISKEIIEVVNSNSGQKYPSEVFVYLDNEMISLKKLADHTTPHIQKETLYFDGDEWLVGGMGDYMNADEYYEDYYDYYDDDEYDETTTYTPRTDEVTAAVAATTYFASEESAQSGTSGGGIPNEVIKLAGSADAVVELCNIEWYKDNLLYDGYYAVDLVPSYVRSKAMFDLSIYGSENGIYYGKTAFESYNQFSAYAQENDETLSKYKNAYFAVLDNKTGEVISNLKGVKSDASAQELDALLLKYPWSVSIRSDGSSFKEGKQFAKIRQSYRDRDVEKWPYSSTLLSDSYTYLGEDCTIYLFVDNLFAGGEDIFSKMGDTYLAVFSKFRQTTVLTIAALLGLIACIVILVIKSGRKHGDGKLYMMRTDKIPSLLRTAINAVLIVGLGWLWFFLTFVLYLEMRDEALTATSFWHKLITLGASLCAAVLVALLIDWLTFVARHIKNGTLFKNTLLGIIIVKIKKAVRAIREKPVFYSDIFKSLLKRVLIFVLLPNLVLGLLALADGDGFGVFLLFLLAIYDLVLLVLAIIYFYKLRQIFYALNEIRNGNYDVTIDTSSMPRFIRAYANDVTAIRQGLQVAVDNAVKEQRMKTELITNVSHDLKTPLTSIINYVDLLSRCEIEDENAKQYIDVLGEKSARLKRLIEDLVEASKASSGAVNVELIKVSLNELARQVAGEYEDEFEKRGLTLIAQETQNEVTVLADSKLCYRVFDNLMSNVKKYAMPGTRVYLAIYREGNKGVIRLRNVSENQLNIPASELKSRFVRGDSSRSTDGNGLGLSIAENFCTLQGGKLDIDISGDLFTVTVEYELA